MFFYSKTKQACAAFRFIYLSLVPHKHTQTQSNGRKSTCGEFRRGEFVRAHAHLHLGTTVTFVFDFLFVFSFLCWSFARSLTLLLLLLLLLLFSLSCHFGRFTCESERFVCEWVCESVWERESARANSGSNQGLSFRLLVCVFWQFNYVCWCVLISVCWPHGICARRKHEQTRRIVCSCAYEAGRMGYYD